MIVVHNRIAQCDDGRRRALAMESMTLHMQHRISFAGDDGAGVWDDVHTVPDEQLTGPLVARRFMDRRRYRDDKARDWRDRPGSYTGGEMPYPFVGRVDGFIDQCLEVGDYGPHARRWSWHAVATAWVGDFRSSRPTSAQWAAAVEWAALWSAWSCPPKGHDEAAGGSADSSKQCPGQMFSMDDLRQQSAAHPLARLDQFEAERYLLGLGVVF